MPVKRPEVKMSDEVYESLREWAKEEGFRMDRAWTEIVKKGLEAEGVMNNG